MAALRDLPFRGYGQFFTKRLSLLFVFTAAHPAIIVVLEKVVSKLAKN